MKVEELFDLTGKTALIIGATSGCGLACSQFLAQAGARIIGGGRSLEKLEKVNEEFKNKGFEFSPCVIDLESFKSVQEELKPILDKERIDILVVVGGLNLPTPVMDLASFEAFQRCYHTNVFGPFAAVQVVAQHMKAHNIAGSIITIGSIRAKDRPTVHEAGYSGSKAAIIQLTKQLVGELAPHKIRINCMILGPNMTESMMKRVGDKLPLVEKKVPLGFVGEPKDLMGTFLLLASNRASRYITGTCITIDGGLSWGRA